MGCLVRRDTVQPVIFFLQQTDAPKTLGWCEEAAQIRGAWRRAQVTSGANRKCYLTQQVCGLPSDWVWVWAPLLSLSTTTRCRTTIETHSSGSMCSNQSTCPCVVWWCYRIFGESLRHDAPPYHHKLCIRPESCHAHFSPIWSERLPSFHIYVCACHKQVKLWRHRRHSSTTSPSHWGQSGTDGRADGTDIRDADTLLFLCPRITDLHDSHRACRGWRQVEMIISIHDAPNSPLIVEHGMIEHLSKNPWWTWWTCTTFSPLSLYHLNKSNQNTEANYFHYSAPHALIKIRFVLKMSHFHFLGCPSNAPPPVPEYHIDIFPVPWEHWHLQPGTKIPVALITRCLRVTADVLHIAS